MKIGPYKIYSIETSEFRLDGGAMFGIIPKTLWEKKIPSDDFNRIPMVTRSLLLVSKNKKILVDTGNGTKWSEKLKHIYNINTDRYNIQSGLSKLDIKPEDITDVICTHLHFDHVGGNTSIINGKIQPTFENAKYWISQNNWTLANNPTQKDQSSFMSHDWNTLQENGMIHLVKNKEQFLDGIDFQLTFGHTSGLLHPIISDNNNTLFFGSDLFPTSAHIPIPWVMAYDINPVKTVKEKLELLPKMVEDNWIIFLEHDQNIQACSVKQEGKHFLLNKVISINE